MYSSLPALIKGLIILYATYLFEVIFKYSIISFVVLGSLQYFKTLILKLIVNCESLVSHFVQQLLFCESFVSHFVPQLPFCESLVSHFVPQLLFCESFVSHFVPQLLFCELL